MQIHPLGFAPCPSYRPNAEVRTARRVCSIMLWLACVLTMLATAPALGAQQLPTVWLGGGVGLLEGEDLSGSGVHALADVDMALVAEDATAFVEVVYQRAEGNGFGCRRLDNPCLGRTDRVRQFGALVGVRAAFGPWFGVLHPYIPAGLGVLRREIRSAESQGPMGICFRDGEPGICRDDPAFGTERFEQNETLITVAAGFGATLRVAGFSVFAETRFYVVGDRDRSTDFVPLTIGIAF